MRAFILSICGLLWANAVTPCLGADSYWTAGSGNFTNPANWSAGVPGAGDNAQFNLASSYTVSLTSDQTTSNTFFNPTSGTVTLDLGVNAWTTPNLFWIGQIAGANSTVAMTGGTLIVTNAAGTADLTVGRFGLGAFHINGGSVLSQGGTVGFTGNGNLIQVSGPGTLWSNSGTYFLGYLGVNSRIIVTNNAQFNAGSGILYIGYAGKTNSLIVTDGGVVNSATTYFSTDAASGGRDNSALVTGSNSVWTNSGAILLGLNGAGNSLVVSNSGRLVSSTLYVGFNSPTNRLTIYSGASVFSTNLFVSFAAGANTGNSLTIASGGNLIVTNAAGTAAALIGFSGSGDLTVQSGGTARINNLGVGVGTVNNSGTLIAGAFNVTNGTVNLSGNSLTDVGSGGILNIGNAAGFSSTLNALSGTNIINSALIRLGENAGGSGRLLVSGPGTILTNSGSIEVGRFGDNSQMVISNGATVNNQTITLGTVGAGNQLIVTGPGSVLHNQNSLSVFLGYFGRNNALIVTNGATVNNAGSMFIGYLGGPSNQLIITDGGKVLGGDATFGTDPSGAGSNNFAIVTGAGSLWENNAINLGHFGSGNQIIVTNGGTLRTGTLTVGNNGSRSQVQVGLGGSLIASTAVTMGNASASTNNSVIISGGSLFVTNSGSTAVLNAGAAGDGNLTLHSGTVTVDRLFVTNGARSTLTFHGGTLHTRNTTVANGSAATVGNGSSAATLNLVGGSHSFANGLNISSNASLTGLGTITANTTVAGGGTLSPGNSTAIITNIGNLTLAANSTYVVELNGTTPGAGHDQVDVTGLVSLSGANLSYALGLGPAVGDQFVIINNDASDAVTGTFAGLPQSLEFGMSLDGTRGLKINYSGGTGNDVVLIVIPEPGSLCLLGLAGLVALRRRIR